MSDADVLSRLAALEDCHSRQINDLQRQLDDKDVEMETLSNRFRETNEYIRELQDDVRQVCRDALAEERDRINHHETMGQELVNVKRQIRFLKMTPGTTTNSTADKRVAEEVKEIRKTNAEFHTQVEAKFNNAILMAKKHVDDEVEGLVKEDQKLQKQVTTGSDRADKLAGRFNELVQRHNELSTDFVRANAAVENLESTISQLQEQTAASQPQDDVNLVREELQRLMGEVNGYSALVLGLLDRVDKVE